MLLDFDVAAVTYFAIFVRRREIKKILIDILVDIIEKHQAARALVTPEIVKAFQAKRKLVFKGL